MVMPDWQAPTSPEPVAELSKSSTSWTVTEPLARPVDRLAAAIVDVFVFLVPAFVLLSAPFKKAMTTSYLVGSEPDFIAWIAWMAALAFALLIVYQSVAVYLFGCTLGQRLFDLRVRPVFANQRLTFWACVGRSCIWILEVFLLGIPFLSIFSNVRRRPWHDRLSDTVVVSRSAHFVTAPSPWERGLVRGFFAACVLLAALVFVVQIHDLMPHLKHDHGLASLLDREAGLCEAVSHAVEEQAPEEADVHARLKLGMSLYAAGLVERNCLEAELENEIANHNPVSGITYLAQAFVNSDDAEVSNSYLDQVCEEQPNSVECTMSQVVSKWSEEDWKSVEELLNGSPRGSGYLEVWAVRHHMRQGQYAQALSFLDALNEHRELADFVLQQRVKALYSAYSVPEANTALAQALTVLPKQEGEDLGAWVCAQELQKDCAAVATVACHGMHPLSENPEVDYERTGVALAQLMTSECQQDKGLDYLSLSESTQNADWRNFFRAELKTQKGDKHAATELLDQVVAGSETPELLRVEALRRLTQIADIQELQEVIKTWGTFESKESWARAGNILFSSLIDKNDQTAALSVARELMNGSALAPQSLAQLTEMAGRDLNQRKPASVGGAPPINVRQWLRGHQGDKE